MKILGIDGSLRGTGLAVIEWEGNHGRAVHGEVVKVPASAAHSECLRRIRERVDVLLAEHGVESAAIEAGFCFKNSKVSLVLGEVRGVAISCCAAAGVPVHEYAPRRAKQNITGWGAAPKEQVARMVQMLLGMRREDMDDNITDAYAIALCHANALKSVAGTEPL